ncbi:hypothetical protein N7517_002492 [Penicillium concentricum]|uniref:Xylanolytic transcriptional activator regulatory domain-containing protein n=1 Tax=Penicillium concentricum TaxID=293559 RepID=A0A9W9VLH9_9EURO|nr:uncharacterized protein N7517_002492 [Penicillium concentricum]KAJ5384581.1 hypothetical protein N7517_002492 [Penicillium concentricum]
MASTTIVHFPVMNAQSCLPGVKTYSGISVHVSLDVYKRHGDRCRATGPPIRTPQPQVPWEDTHTPQAMVGIPSPLTTNRNPAERVVTDEDFWEEHSTFATELPQSFSSSSPSNQANSEETYVKQYFEHFHPSFPLLHRPTFAVSSTPKLLLKAVIVIGSLFSPNLYDHEETQALAHWRQDIWQSGQEELRHMV